MAACGAVLRRVGAGQPRRRADRGGGGGPRGPRATCASWAACSPARRPAARPGGRDAVRLHRPGDPGPGHLPGAARRPARRARRRPQHRSLGSPDKSPGADRNARCLESSSPSPLCSPPSPWPPAVAATAPRRRAPRESCPPARSSTARLTLDPEGDQQAAIDALIEKFPGEGSAGERIRGLMEQAFADSDIGLSYSKDIEPWLGDQAAFFVSRLSADGDDGDGALLLATDDEDKAMARHREGHRRGQEGQLQGHTTTYVDDDGAAGVVDGWVVIGHRARLQVHRRHRRGRRVRSRTTRPTRRRSTDAPDERLGFVYFNTPAFAEAASQRSARGAPLGPFARLLQGPGARHGSTPNEHGVRLEATLPESLSQRLPDPRRGRRAAPASCRPTPGSRWPSPTLARRSPASSTSYRRRRSAAATTIEQQLKAATGLDLAGRRDLLDGRLEPVRARHERGGAERRAGGRDERRGRLGRFIDALAPLGAQERRLGRAGRSRSRSPAEARA